MFWEHLGCGQFKTSHPSLNLSVSTRSGRDAPALSTHPPSLVTDARGNPPRYNEQALPTVLCLIAQANDLCCTHARVINSGTTGTSDSAEKGLTHFQSVNLPELYPCAMKSGVTSMSASGSFPQE